jgi:endonuclease/exonuclease/phosphatase family metal-dependent hydrolase
MARVGLACFAASMAIAQGTRADSVGVLRHGLSLGTNVMPFGAVVASPLTSAGPRVLLPWLLYEAERFVQHAQGLDHRPALRQRDATDAQRLGAPAGGEPAIVCAELFLSDDGISQRPVSANVTDGEGVQRETALHPSFGSLCWLTLVGTHGMPVIAADGTGAAATSAVQEDKVCRSEVASSAVRLVTHRLTVSIGEPHGELSVYEYSYGCGPMGNEPCAGTPPTPCPPFTVPSAEGNASDALDVAADAAVTAPPATLTPAEPVQAEPAAPSSRPLARLLSFNTWNVNPPSWVWRDPRDRSRQYAFRALAIADVLRSADADIVAFQEVRYDSTLGGWDSPASAPAASSHPVFGPLHAAAESGGIVGALPLADMAVEELDALDVAEDEAHGLLTRPMRGQTNDFKFAHNVARYWYDWTRNYTTNTKFTDKGRAKWAGILGADGWAAYAGRHPTEGVPCPPSAADTVPMGVAAGGEALAATGCSPYIHAGLPPRANPSIRRVQRALRRHPHSQAMHLASLLPQGWQFAFQPASLYFDQGAWVSGSRQRDEEGPAIFSRWPIQRTHALLLSRNATDEGDVHQRLCLHAAVRVPSSGPTDPARIIDVYTVHLPLSEAARNRSIGELLTFIGETAGGEAIVLAGDMNAEPQEAAMRALIGKLDTAELVRPDGTPLPRPTAAQRGGVPAFSPSLSDAWLTTGNPEPEPRSPDAAVRRYGLTFPSDAPVKRIDMVLTGAGPAAAGGPGARRIVTPSRAWLLGQDALPGTDAFEGRGGGMTSEQSPVYASDHRALVVELLEKPVPKKTAVTTELTLPDVRGELPPLHVAARANRVAAIAELLAGGEAVDGRDVEGRTALLLTSKKCHPDAAGALVAAGADVNAADENGRTPLMEAAASCHTVFLELLLAAGGNVNAADAHGHTPLMAAAHVGHEAGVALLLSRGAKVDAVSDNGRTAKDWARDAGKERVVEMLSELS